MPGHYFTQADLESAVGGATALRKLLPLPGTAVADPAAVDKCLSMADGWIRETIGFSFGLASFDAKWFGTDPKPFDADSKKSVATQAEFLLAYAAHWKGTGGQAIPPEVATMKGAAFDALKQMGERKLGLGTDNQPATSRHYRLAQPLTPGNVPTGSHRAAFKGFT